MPRNHRKVDFFLFFLYLNVAEGYVFLIVTLL